MVIIATTNTVYFLHLESSILINNIAGAIKHIMAAQNPPRKLKMNRILGTAMANSVIIDNTIMLIITLAQWKQKSFQ